ncbi:MAG TPA: cold-shock protein [Deltaproteobacteria bacterium]|nr:cold-shock protein [Deltaproteobacteria bacterium]
MYTGTIKWFDFKNGYGFIDNDEGGIILLHYNAVRSRDYCRVHSGRRINFDI